VKETFEGRPPNHPILIGINDVMVRSEMNPDPVRLSGYHLLRVIEAREKQFLSPSFKDLNHFFKHVSDTVATLLYLQLQLVSPLPSSKHQHGDHHRGLHSDHSAPKDGLDLMTLDHSLSHLANAIGVSELLQSAPLKFQQGIRGGGLPESLEMEASSSSAVGSTQDRLSSSLRSDSTGKEELDIVSKVHRLTTLGLMELELGKSLLGEGRKANWAHPVFLSAVPAATYLRKVEKKEWDLNKTGDGSLEGGMWNLWTASKRGEWNGLARREQGWLRKGMLD